MSEVAADPLDLANAGAPTLDLLSLPRPRVLRTGVVLAVLLGLGIATAVLATAGFGDILKAVRAIGLPGLAVLVLWTPGPLLLLGGAWFLLADGEDAANRDALRAARPRLGDFVWARLVRDASGELLPFSHVGGFFIGARAAILRGVAPRAAFATSVGDVSAELLAQLVFTGVALGWLTVRVGAGAPSWLGGALLGLFVGAAALGGFMLLQGRGGRLIDRLAGQLFPALARRSPGLGAAVQDLYARPWRLLGAAGLHLGAWVASALGCWAALNLTGAHVAAADILALEALVAAVRSALVVAPMGIGVQEAAYAFVGPLLGLGPDLALALSLIKRARDLVVGIPALAAWQGVEGARALRSRPAEATKLGSPGLAPASTEAPPL
jgi:putative membrane protein